MFGSFISSDAAVGVPDPSNGETKLTVAADGGDHVNLTNAGFGAIANAYLGSQNEWMLTDGSTDNPVTTAMDTGHSGAPYLSGDTQAGNDPLTLSGNTSWPNDSVRGPVLGLDGTNAYAAAPGQVLTTTTSFSISTWAKLSSAAQDADIVSQDAPQTSGFALQYDHADNRWAFTMPTSDTANPNTVKVLSTAAPTVGTWTHFVATYNATNGLMSLYVNGALQGTATNATPVNATGTLVFGRGLANGAPTAYFPGDISTMDTWNYALTLTQIAALYEQIS